jgi:hypothetical protein
MVRLSKYESYSCDKRELPKISYIIQRKNLLKMSVLKAPRIKISCHEESKVSPKYDYLYHLRLLADTLKTMSYWL